MAGVGVVVNPEAGRNRRVAERARRLSVIVGADGCVREPQSLQELDEVAREFRDRGIDILAVCGGDGSFFRALSACVRAYGVQPLPPLLALRAGTMNTIARDIAAPRGLPEAVLARAIERYRQRRAPVVKHRQLLRVGERFVGFMAGVGAIVSFLEAYYRGRLRGRLGAARLLLLLLGSARNGGEAVNAVFRWVNAEVWSDGERIPFERFSIIYASTIQHIGLGFRPTYRAHGTPGHFQLLAGPLDAAEAVRCLPRFWRGVPSHSRQLHDAMAHTVSIEFGAPTSYMVDGDVLDPVSRLTIGTGPILHIMTDERAV